MASNQEAPLFELSLTDSSERSTPTSGSITENNVIVHFPEALARGLRTPEEEAERVQRISLVTYRRMVQRRGQRPPRAVREEMEQQRQENVARWMEEVQAEERAEVKAVEEGMRRPPVSRARELGDNICHDLSIHASGWNNHRTGRSGRLGLPPPRSPPGEALAGSARASYNRNSTPRWRIERVRGADRDNNGINLPQAQQLPADNEVNLPQVQPLPAEENENEENEEQNEDSAPSHYGKRARYN